MEDSHPSSQYNRAMVHKWLAMGWKLDSGGESTAFFFTHSHPKAKVRPPG